MEGGISCPWCVWKALAAPSPLLSYSQSSCSLSFLEGMGNHGGIYATNDLLVIMAWISLPGKDPEQFLQLPSCLCSGHGKCEVEESKACF